MNLNPSAQAQNILQVDPNSQIFLYIWNRCDHSKETIKDLRQLEERVQDRIEVIDIETVMDDNNYPPGLNCTPCLFITSPNGKVAPQIFNGRKSILIFCKMKAHDAKMTQEISSGKEQMTNRFANSDVNERHSRDISGVQNAKGFSELDNPETSGKRERLFDDFIEDPLLADDPRLNSSPKDLKTLMEERGYKN